MRYKTKLAAKVFQTINNPNFISVLFRNFILSDGLKKVT